jgi:hypothetical protein
MVYLRGYVMLYPNYDNFVSLSTNHLEIGSHVKAQPDHLFMQKKALFTLPLMQVLDVDNDVAGSRVANLLDLPEYQLPDLVDLPTLDLMATLTSTWEIEMRGRERQEDLFGCVTVASRSERLESFEALDLFTCNSAIVDDDEGLSVFGGFDIRDDV